MTVKSFTNNIPIYIPHPGKDANNTKVQIPPFPMLSCKLA